MTSFTSIYNEYAEIEDIAGQSIEIYHKYEEYIL